MAIACNLLPDGWQLENTLSHVDVGVCVNDGLCVWAATLQFDEWVAEQLEIAKSLVSNPNWEQRREAVRGMLRTGGFKPSGRSKPAQEYLLRCLNDGNFPRINPAVDCLNVLSLQIGLPISMLRMNRFEQAIRLRLGQPDEQYVFNSGGQQLDLAQLIVTCGGPSRDEPLGTPVKDSMAGKITSEVTSVVSLMYVPSGLLTAAEIADATAKLQSNIRRFACAQPEA